MRTGFKAPFSTAVAIAVGLIVLLGYLVNFGLLASLREVFVRWAVLLAAVALFAGLINLAGVHLNKVNTRQSGSFNSFVLLFMMITTLLVAGIMGPTNRWAMWIYQYVQVPIESSLMAILAVILVFAGTRVLRQRVSLFSLVFLGVAFLVLLGTASNPWLSLPVLADIRSWIMQVPAAAGARGILLGVALGSIATGLRVLLGADRPYEG